MIEKVKISRNQSSILVMMFTIGSSILIFSFGEDIHRNDPKEWKKLKENWNQEFSELQVNNKVNAKITHLGAINNSF